MKLLLFKSFSIFTALTNEGNYYLSKDICQFNHHGAYHMNKNIFFSFRFKY